MLGQRSPRRRTKNGGITAQQIKPSVHAQPPIGEPLHTMPLTDKEDATMKKKTLSILSLCIALFAAFALVGCGGSASGGGGSAAKSESKEKAPVAKKTDFIWFKVEMPEGVGVSDPPARMQIGFSSPSPKMRTPRAIALSPFGKKR